MRSSTLLTGGALMLASTTLAQNATSNSSVIRITVGEGGFVFNPASVMAAPGTKIEFDFYPGNHSVVQGDYNSACHPSARAFYSGFIPSNSGVANTSFVLTINDTSPIWYYCSQANHCQTGMVGVINPPNGTNETLAAYKAASAKATQNISPAGGIEGGSSAPNGSAVASASSAASASATASGTSGGSGGSGGSATGTATGAAASSSKSGVAAAVSVEGPGGVLTGLVMGILAMLL